MKQADPGDLPLDEIGEAALPNGAASAQGRPGYLELSRSLATSFLFILPLLMVYELGLATESAAAEVVKWPLLVFFERRAALAFNVLVAVGMVVAVAVLRKRDRLRPAVFLPMFMESALYALLLAPLLWFGVRRHLYVPDLAWPKEGFLHGAAVAAGAGVYEELLFRGALLGSLCFIGERALKIHSWLAVPGAILVSAAVFSLMHFVGMGGEPFDPERFVFRLVAGLVLSGIFLARGLGIAAYAHAIHNVLVLCTTTG